jgi:hypothetical protein
MQPDGPSGRGWPILERILGQILHRATTHFFAHPACAVVLLLLDPDHRHYQPLDIELVQIQAQTPEYFNWLFGA